MWQMRHLIGLILAIALSAALFFGAAWGVNRIIEMRGTVTAVGTQHALTSTHGLIAVAAVVGTGLLLGILMSARPVSALATGLPGLVLLAWSTLVVLHNRYAFRYMPLPNTHFGEGFSYLLFNGILALAGAAMIIPLAIPSRWRRPRGTYVDDEEPEDLSMQTALGLTP
jgi:hypothetical protein